MAHWYYSTKNKKEGPLSKEELIEKIRNGTLKHGVLVWKQGLKTWQPIDIHFSQYFDQVAPLTSPLLDEIISVKENKIEEHKKFLFLLKSIWAPLAIAFFGGLQFYLVNINLALNDFAQSGTIWLFSLVLAIIAAGFVVLCIWKKGNKKQTESGGYKGGGYKLASVFLGLVFFAFSVVYLAQAPVFFRVDKVRKAYDNFTMDVDVVGKKIVVTGTIGPSFSSRLEHNLDLYAGINTIIITSPGGLIDQALKTAKIIERHPDMKVIAQKECNSSCLIILMAAESRYADWDMSLGFHATSLITKLPAADAGLVQFSDEADQYLIKRGVPNEVLKHAFGSNEKNLESIPAIALATSGTLNGLVDGNSPISIETAKWKTAEDALKHAEGKLDIPLSIILQTVRENAPEVVKKYADTLYQSYMDADPEKMKNSTRSVLFELISPAMQSADDKEMYDYIDSNFKQMAHLINMEQWDACINYIEGDGVSEIITLSHEGLKQEMSALVSLIKSASRRHWKPHSTPSWVKDRISEIVVENVTSLIEKGVDVDQFENNKRVKCQYSYSIMKTIMNEGKNNAPALMRWINSPEYLGVEKSDTGNFNVVGNYSSDAGATMTTAEIAQQRNGNYMLEYTTATASGCIGEFSGAGRYEARGRLVFIDPDYPSCHVSVTPASNYKEIDIRSTEECQVFSGMRCGIYGHLTKE